MMNTNYNSHLIGLKGSDFQLVSDEPNIIDWQVEREGGGAVGVITDLLFDPDTKAVRYLIIDLTGNGMDLDNKHIMIPIGIAHLHENNDTVVLPNIHLSQFIALPDYQDGEVNPQIEAYIREVIGSPAALRLEEQTAQIDQDQFYQHQHFDQTSFYTKGGNANRNEEQRKIHDLIDQAKRDHKETVQTIDGQVLVQGTPHAVKPWLDQDDNRQQTPTNDRSNTH